jgi:fido (protein-threonine AMPylation protein)
MGWRCTGCGLFRARVGERSCKPTRVCRQIDVTLPSHRPNLTLPEYREIHRTLWANYEAAGRFAAQQGVPQTPGAFQQLIKELHRRIFSVAIPAIAGEYRKAPVYFGCGSTEFAGCPHDRIEVKMDALFDRCAFSTAEFSAMPRALFVRKVSVFLEAFFMIHPFPDGNGRVARLFTSLLCKRSERWAFALDRDGQGNHRKRRKYVRALNWAHDAIGQDSAAPRRPRRHPYLLLDRWLDERLEVVIPDSDLIEEPPAPRPSSRPPRAIG